MPLTSPGNDDDTGENHQPTLRKNTAEPVEQTLKQNTSEPLPELHAEIEREQRRAGELSERIRDMRDQYDTARSRAEHVADDYRDRLRELSDKCGAALDAETARLELFVFN